MTEQNYRDSDLFYARMTTRMMDSLTRANRIPANAPGSVEWCYKAGRFWVEQRTSAGLDAEQAAKLIPTQLPFLWLFENGWATPAEIRGDFPPRYARALGNTDLYTRFCTLMEITPYIEEDPETSLG